MDNSIYIALSKQLGQFRDMDVTANNIANVDTVGYNAEKMMFTDYLVDDGNRRKMAFAQDISSYRNLKNGSMKVTGNAFDLAINGPGYFVVETEQGNRYTKAGNFQLSGDGTLVTPDGFPVLSSDGERLVFEPDARDIVVGENGVVTVNGDESGQVGLVEFADEQSMQRIDNQLYATDQAPQPPQTSRMLQGVLEGSNVSAVQELVYMTRLSNSVGSTSKFIEVMYDLQRKASNAYARPAQR